MTRAQSYGAPYGSAGHAQDRDGFRTFTVRELVAYGRLIVNRERVDPERVVRDFIRANPDVDLEARSTITAWQEGARPGARAVRPGDTAERPGGYF
ncbi:hypothetical protein [Nocardioides nitrophenolicus]|uniref:hypothetical protein n=1 Tax=Nocardioides nitrophenolicus TaxID=60489 RepID=UPI001958671B|nr:hypothetical protein [Nocardioides nitrophenolicus]MBM7517634.1 hypothetical protein [Nocardioides nitrophenolicus]